MTTKRKKSKTGGKAKTTVAIVNGIRIRERREGCYVIQVRRSGLNHFETFASLDAAKLKCEQLHTEQVNNGLSAFEIDGRTRTDAKDAAQILAGRCSLADAARLWVKHNPDGGAVTVSELVELYLSDLKRRNVRPATLADARIRLGKFAGDYGAVPVMSVTPENLAEWITLRGCGPVNQNNHRRKLGALFSYAVKRRVVDANPVLAVEPVPTDATLPTIWQPARVESVLRAAQSFNPDMVPVLAVMAWAGLRPHEAARLDWQDVKLSERIIRIMPGTSKVRQARVVDVSDNLAAWLAPYQRDRGPIAPAQITINRWRVRLAAAAVVGIEKVQARFAKQDGLKGTEIKKKRLGWDAAVQDARKADAELWPHDILRHSCATAWLAANHDIHKLAEMLGNSAAVIRRHYKGMMTAKEAAQYWEIMPDKSGGKVIELRKAAGQ